MAGEIEAIRASIQRSVERAPRYVESTAERVSDLSKSFHQTLITVASGGVLLSVSLLEKELITRLSVFWPSVAFTTVLLIVLLAFIASRVAFSKSSEAVQAQAYRFEQMELAVVRADFARATDLLTVTAGEQKSRKHSKIFRRVALVLESLAVVWLVAGIWVLLEAVRQAR